MRSESDTNRTLMFRFVGTTGWLPGITATQLLGRPPDTWSTRSVYGLYLAAPRLLFFEELCQASWTSR